MQYFLRLKTWLLKQWEFETKRTMKNLLKDFTQHIVTTRRLSTEGQVRDSPTSHSKRFAGLMSLCLSVSTPLQIQYFLIFNYSLFIRIFPYTSTLSNLKSKDYLHLGYDAIPLGNRFPVFQMNIKAKKSLYRPEQTLRAPGVSGFQISRRQVHEGARLSALHTGRLYPLPPPTPKIFLVIIFFRG